MSESAGDLARARARMVQPAGQTPPTRMPSLDAAGIALPAVHRTRPRRRQQIVTVLLLTGVGRLVIGVKALAQ